MQSLSHSLSVSIVIWFPLCNVRSMCECAHIIVHDYFENVIITITNYIRTLQLQLLLDIYSNDYKYTFAFNYKKILAHISKYVDVIIMHVI